MKNNKGAWIILGVLVVVGIIVVNSTGSGSSSPSTTASLSDTQQSICSSDIATLKTQTKTVDFKQLNKDPDSFKNTLAEYTGQIVQIQESNGQGVIRLSVTKESYGWSMSDIIFVTYQGHTDAVQDDVVTVYGYLAGSYTYTSQANFQITVPSFVACEVDKGAPVSVKTSPTKPATATPVPSTSANATQSSQPTPVKSTPTVIPPVIPPAPQATWHTVTTASNNIQTQTAPFAMHGTQWRVTYSCSVVKPEISVNGFIGSIDSAADGSQVNNFADLINGCPTSNTSYVYGQTPGQYSLDLEPTNASYNVTLEDYY